MAARFSISISGIKELKQRYSPENFRRAFAQAVVPAFEPARAAIAAAAAVAGRPHRKGKSPGELKRHIKIRVGRRGGSSFTVTITGPGYGHLVDAGHNMVTGGKISRARSLGGKLANKLSGRFTGSVVGHVAALPFARQAFESQQVAIAHGIEGRLATALGV